MMITDVILLQYYHQVMVVMIYMYISPMKALNFILQNHRDSYNLSLLCHDIVYKLVVAGLVFHVNRYIYLSAQSYILTE
jgi:hypothetical protein